MNDTPASLPDHPFWRFSLEVYQQSPASQALLHLQQQYGLNVNIMLFCCWWACSGQGILVLPEIQRLFAKTALWHNQVVVVLRNMRRRLKKPALPPQVQGWGRMLFQEELFAEHIEQLMLAETLIRTPSPKVGNLTHVIGNVCRNLQLYFKSQQVQLAPKEEKYLCQLINAVFPKAKIAAISATYRKIFDP
ncbi:MAG: TIGR02444 family protein [Gammaproteobacteria bacterium]